MNKPLPWIACLSAMVLLLAVNALQSKDEPVAGVQPTPEQVQEMMKMWVELSKPGEPHAKLAGFVGEWDVVSKMFMAGPDGPATESKGKSTIRSVLGGRFIEEHFVGEMVMPDENGAPQAVPFEGLSLLGYDNYKKSYVGSWADSMGTVLLTFKGVDNPTKPDELTFYGEMDEPMLGMQDRLVKYHRKVISRDKYVFSMYDLAVSEDYLVMELTCTRRNAASPEK